MKYIIIILLFFGCAIVEAQEISYKPDPSKFQFSFNSGLYADLFYADIFAPKDDSPSLIDGKSYPDKKQTEVKPGLISKLELIYNHNNKTAFSLAFSQASWRDLYGIGNDPLEFWKDYKRYKKRLQFSANYYHKIQMKQNSKLNLGLGFMVQGEQFNNNGYFVNNGTLIFSQNNAVFYDPVIAGNVTYLYRVNNNLSLGANFFTGYTFGVGIENAALMGAITIDLKNLFKKTKNEN
jgi:hypothetical protein